MRFVHFYKYEFEHYIGENLFYNIKMKFKKLRINFKFFKFQFYSHAKGFYMIENEIYHYSDEFYIDILIPNQISPALPQKWPK